MLTIFLDTESLNKCNNNEQLKNLLCLDRGYFKFFRTAVETNNGSLENVPVIPVIEPELNGSKHKKKQELDEKIYQSLNFRPKNQGQYEFFELFFKFANFKNEHYKHNSI